MTTTITTAERTEARIAVARLRKAHAIVEVLRRHGCDADHAEQIVSQEARDVVAELAEVNSPSPASWAVAVELLRLSESEAS